MSCDAWREQLSARADGEDDPRSARLLDAHLDRCPACRSYAAALAGIGVPGVADRNPPGPPADLPARGAGPELLFLARALAAALLR